MQELVNYTTDSIYCIILFPIFCLQKMISNRFRRNRIFFEFFALYLFRCCPSMSRQVDVIV